jgi:hypothetical protein
MKHNREERMRFMGEQIKEICEEETVHICFSALFSVAAHLALQEKLSKDKYLDAVSTAWDLYAKDWEERNKCKSTNS